MEDRVRFNFCWHLINGAFIQVHSIIDDFQHNELLLKFLYRQVFQLLFVFIDMQNVI